MRTTKAAYAVERLKKRSGNAHYKMMLNSAGLPFLVLDENGSQAVQCAPMAVEDFVSFVDAFGPQEQKRLTKNDLAFEAQLNKKAQSKE